MMDVNEQFNAEKSLHLPCEGLSLPPHINNDLENTIQFS